MRELFSNLFPLWKVVFLMVEWISAKMIQFLYMICVAHTKFIYIPLTIYGVSIFNNSTQSHPKFAIILWCQWTRYIIRNSLNPRYSKMLTYMMMLSYIYNLFIFGLHHRNRCKWYFSDRRFHRTLKTSFTSSLLCL